MRPNRLAPSRADAANHVKICRAIRFVRTLLGMQMINMSRLNSPIWAKTSPAGASTRPLGVSKPNKVPQTSQIEPLICTMKRFSIFSRPRKKAAPHAASFKACAKLRAACMAPKVHLCFKLRPYSGLCAGYLQPTFSCSFHFSPLTRLALSHVKSFFCKHLDLTG